MQVLVDGGRVQDGRGGKVTRGSTALSRRGRRVTVAISVAAVMVLGGMGSAVPARAMALKPVAESPLPPGPAVRRAAPILRRVESPRNSATFHRRNATSRRRPRRRPSALASAVGHGVRPVKKPPRRESPRKRSIDHAHLGQSHGMPVFVVPVNKPEQRANVERGPPRAPALQPGFIAVPARQSLDLVAADLLGASRAGGRAIPTSLFDFNPSNQLAPVATTRISPAELRPGSPDPSPSHTAAVESVPRFQAAGRTVHRYAPACRGGGPIRGDRSSSSRVNLRRAALRCTSRAPERSNGLLADSRNKICPYLPYGRRRGSRCPVCLTDAEESQGPSKRETRMIS